MLKTIFLFASFFFAMTLAQAQVSGTGGTYFQNQTSCTATTISSCDIPTQRSGGSAGVCTTYYDGSCSYRCFRGTWNQVTNTCVYSACSLPWGGIIANASSVTAYSSATPAGACSSFSETRVCNSGSLSGSFTNNSCVNGCTGTPWGSVSSGFSGTAYLTATVACGSSCTSETRTCTNGSFSGSYTNTSCNVTACASCSLPWGGSISHGQSVTAYAASSVACGGSCTSETRTCNNGTLSGSYTNSSCSVATCSGTWVWQGSNCGVAACPSNPTSNPTCSPIGSQCQYTGGMAGCSWHICQ